MTVKTIDVVCAFIVREPKEGGRVEGEEFQILCSQRYEDAEHFPSMYEFPGGKVDPGETHVEALRRECQEELNVEVEIIRDKGDKVDEAIKPCYTFDHAPKHDKRTEGTVVFHLSFYWARLSPTAKDLTEQRPKALASQRVAWLAPNQMAKLTFCPGDEPIIAALENGTLRPAYPFRPIAAET